MKSQLPLKRSGIQPKWRAATLVALAACLSACGGGGGGGSAAPAPAPTPTPPPVNTAPQFGGNFDFTLDEGQTVTVDIVATDADGDALSLTISGPDANAIAFDAQASSATVGPLDFENPQDADTNNVYAFSVTADDGTDTTSQDFTLTVLNISDNPPVFGGQFDLSVEENQSAAAPFSVTDADGDTLELTLGGPDAALFELDDTTLTVSARETFDFETPADADGDNVYEFEITASDDVDSTTQDFTLTVQNVIDLFQGTALVDPNPAAGNLFGSRLDILANGNLVVATSRDSTTAVEAGAAHLYDPSGERINSFFGAERDQEVGFELVPLSNSNLVVNAGSFGRFLGAQTSSVSLISGTDASEIVTLGGRGRFAFFGNRAIVELEAPNQGNFVIGSPSDDAGGIVDAGSAVLLNGQTGETIARFEGDDQSDFLGDEVVALSNGNFIILSPSSVVNGFTRAGSVLLVDGATGAEIGRYDGEAAQEFVGSRFAVLPNGNFVLGIRSRDGDVADEGLVLLINGANGDVIAEIRGGDVGATFIGNEVAALDNGNFVVGATQSDSAGLTNNGFIGLFDGAGNLLASVFGDDDRDAFGQIVLPLENGRFAVSNPDDSVDGIRSVGSFILFDSSGNEVARLTGDSEFEGFSNDESVPPLQLDNGNIVIVSDFATVGGVPGVGTVVLADGNTLAEITRIDFDNELDLDQAEVFPLPNGNFVIAAVGVDVNGIEDAGSMLLVNGVTGEIILELRGDMEFEGSDFDIEVLVSDHYVYANRVEDVNDVLDAGVVRVINATTGEIVATFEGDQENDRIGTSVVALESGGFLLGSSVDDLDGLVNSGSVMLVTAE
ncbi:MAG: hypothetical protein AAF265_13695 [Pseudomonadota bacterium]